MEAIILDGRHLVSQRRRTRRRQLGSSDVAEDVNAFVAS
jgi:hypothetical protein